MSNITDREIFIEYIRENVYFFTDEEIDHFVDFIITRDIDRRGGYKN